ncbi:MAG: VWA domain-containing protein [bacterium]|nr:VWA domain-containing protein [bacterium]
MSDFQFAEAHWIHAIWAVLAFGLLLFWLERRAGSALDRLLSPLLQSRLVTRALLGQRLVRACLLTLAAIFAVLALMRPQWGVQYISTPRYSAELMICLDVSRSMLAEDAVPNRLERAKAEIRDLLPYLEGDHVGLIAFAGRASVVAPLTPDFGFLRLVLDGIGPTSVSRGGTRLEEPIRRALAGFRASGDISRSILLITDGEDQDSFPLEAAREAGERGISIIAIGFGSETGSTIPITDPKTGAQTLVRDSDGRNVISRLDGETLREIALLTGGAYVPAGTGVLDLESIYERHIQALLRGRIDDRGRAVRQEGFQWALLASLLCLLASVLATSSFARAGPKSGALDSTPLLLVLGLLLSAPAVNAQEIPADPNAPPGRIPELAAPRPMEAEPQKPREVYNRALEQLDRGELDESESALQEARTRAGTDGELRYRAAYTLGYVAAARADAQLESKPQEALTSLYTAADWYRDAVRLRPEDVEARKSLEVVLKRVLVLADSLRDPEDKKLENLLDALIVAQRETVGLLRGLLERAQADPELVSGDALRSAFRTLSATQRQTLSDGDALADRADEERAALAEKPQEELAAEEGIRLAQLEQLMHYLLRGRERMGQARRELRQKRAERAYRRGAAALTELKRARDQLDDPLAVLDAVIRDAAELAAYTQTLLSLQSATGLSEDPSAPRETPAWLTQRYLLESQQGVGLRTRELHSRLSAGIPSVEARTQQEPDPEAERFLKSLKEAEPLIDQGGLAFERADTAFEVLDTEAAASEQSVAIMALIEARERFLDIRGLIDVAHGGQRRIGAVLSPERDFSREQLAEFYPVLRSAQGKNLERADHMGALIDEQIEADAQKTADDLANEDRSKQLELARSILALADDAMHRIHDQLPDPNASRPQAPDVAGLREQNERAVESLEALRRIFFSVVEHLRETAESQQRLNDETEEIAALGVDPNSPPQVEPLLPRQETLAKRADEIATALEEQSRQDPEALVDPGAAALGPDAEAQGEADRLRRAAELVLESSTAMGDAKAKLGLAPPELDPAREQQDQALQGLLQALALLQPPSQEQQEQQEQEQGEGEQEQNASEPEAGEPEESPADPGQLLQSVRDREAERREQREQRRRAGYDTVEKDW